MAAEDSRTAHVVPPPVIFIAALCLGLAVEYFDPQPVVEPANVGYVAGGLLVVLGAALSTWMVLHFHHGGTAVSPLSPSRELVVTGPYRFTRNPDYIGQALVYAGIALVVNSIWVLAGLLPALAIVRFHVIAREERYLLGRFGRRYAEFCERVPRWI
ncbi:MAG TPA: isoprenylcysteine carboxylmethyltransferase family protein [Casimicrobiaceae bacterium]